MPAGDAFDIRSYCMIQIGIQTLFSRPELESTTTRHIREDATLPKLLYGWSLTSSNEPAMGYGPDAERLDD